MRIDVVTIFPDFFAALDVSLLGKAAENGLIRFQVTDLRDFTEDKHRTVDAPPFGGGAGMVMKAEPWGMALDAILDASKQDSNESGPVVNVHDSDSETSKPTIIFTTPAGEVFQQRKAHELSSASHLIFACGRYEGFDDRIIEHYRGRDDVNVLELSIGDYVLNGGEVASIVMIEAIGRLVPGVIGNPESLVHESHEQGLLEYPNYTKPRVWRNLEVPEVLLSGNHAVIDRWRAEQQIIRTQDRRPDLMDDKRSQ